MRTAPYCAASMDGPSNHPGRKLRVLIVDDEKDVALTLSALLRDGGYETQSAHNATEALTALPEFDPDVVICDILMPGMSGWELARQVRKTAGHDRPKLIAISGRYTQSADRLLSESVGFTHFFAKPCDPNVLLKVLAELAGSSS